MAAAARTESTRSVQMPAFDGSQACAGELTRAQASGFSAVAGADPGPAATVCSTCPFVTECRQYAIEHDVQGVWGGTTDRDRAAQRRDLGLAEPRPVSDELDDVVRAWRHLASSHEQLATADVA